MSAQKKLSRRGQPTGKDRTNQAAAAAQPENKQEAVLNNEMPYAVGYRRPPRHSQFKKGRSGNPRGRPKRSRDLRSEIQKVLTDRIPVRVGGKTRRVPALIAVQYVTLNRALKGNHGAAAALLKTAKDYGLLEQDQVEGGEKKKPPISYPTPADFESMSAEEIEAALVKILQDHGVIEADAGPAMIDVTPEDTGSRSLDCRAPRHARRHRGAREPYGFRYIQRRR
jgi:hypothetical protein